MIIKLPNKVKIGTHTYKIVFDSNMRGDDNLYGQVNYRTQEIRIWTDAPPSVRNETLLHEILHLAVQIYRVELTDPDIDRVAATIADFLFNNLGLEFNWDDIEDVK